MDDSKLQLIVMTGEDAARVAAGMPQAGDDWAPGFPRQDDREAASSARPAPFGCYRIVSGQTIGTAGFYGPPDESGQVTIGYGLVSQERGKGYGTEVVAGLIGICRHNGGVSAILADTDPDNVASRRVLEKNGFELVRATGESCFFELRLS